jgi:RNA polymerase sigma-70 factor (ECF subfamily)
MSSQNTFRDLLERVRAGDEKAAAQLVREYEPQIRRAVRMQLTDPGLNRLLDSVDICQSVLANFFVRMAAGQFEFESPGHLLKLLTTMARNKLYDHARRHQAECRDRRRLGEEEDAEGFLDPHPSPGQVVANRDLLEQVLRRLGDDERYLVDQRSLGRSWPDLAGELHTSADALRMKLTRALDRVSRELGLDEGPAE